MKYEISKWESIVMDATAIELFQAETDNDAYISDVNEFLLFIKRRNTDKYQLLSQDSLH